MRTHDKAKFHDRKLRLKLISMPKICFKTKADPAYASNPHQWANKMEILRQLSH